MDDLIDFMQSAGTHCSKDAYDQLKENIRMCENALITNHFDDTSIKLRNINTNYCNDIIFDIDYYKKFEIEDYLEYIRFINFLMNNYWDTVRNESQDTKKQIEISLRIYKEFAEGLAYNYKVFCKFSNNPYFSTELPTEDYGTISENIRMCENAMRNFSISLETAKKVLEINSMYSRDIQLNSSYYPTDYVSHINELSDIMRNYWNIVDDGGPNTIQAQLQLSYRFYRKLLECYENNIPILTKLL